MDFSQYMGLTIIYCTGRLLLVVDLERYVFWEFVRDFEMGVGWSWKMVSEGIACYCSVT